MGLLAARWSSIWQSLTSRNSGADHMQFPVTLAFPQKVGTIMAEVDEGEEPQTRFRYYI